MQAGSGSAVSKALGDSEGECVSAPAGLLTSAVRLWRRGRPEVKDSYPESEFAQDNSGPPEMLFLMRQT